MVAVRRVPALEHNFNIVVTRVFEDGDQELLEDEEESKHPNLHFLLTSERSPCHSRRRADLPHRP